MYSEENQRDIEARVWELTKDYLRQATPQERHLFVLESNYDGSSSGVRYLVDDPQLDRATALALFWRLGASYYASYESIDSIPDFQREDYELINLIAARYCSGYYANHGIGFDPCKDSGLSPVAGGADSVRSGIDPLMYQALDGVWVRPVGAYEEGVSLDLFDRIMTVVGN